MKCFWLDRQKERETDRQTEGDRGTERGEKLFNDALYLLHLDEKN